MPSPAVPLRVSSDRIMPSPAVPLRVSSDQVARRPKYGVRKDKPARVEQETPRLARCLGRRFRPGVIQVLLCVCVCAHPSPSHGRLY